MPVNKFTAETLQLITKRLTSLHRRYIKPISDNEHNPKRSSVLLPLCNDNNIPSILYTKRSSQLRHHNSEISFPGGRIDQNENDIQCALRELYEEVNISDNDVQVLGKCM